MLNVFESIVVSFCFGFSFALYVRMPQGIYKRKSRWTVLGTLVCFVLVNTWTLLNASH